MLDTRLPVLRCTVEGDEEGRTIRMLGWYNGRIEDILREAAPKAIHAPPCRSGVDYEVSVDYYEGPTEALAYLSEQMGLSPAERTPDILYVPKSTPSGIRVEVRIWPDDKVDQFLAALRPDTKRKRLPYQDGRPSNTIALEL